VQKAIDPIGRDLLFQRHGLKARHTGHRLLVEVHLLSPFAGTLGEARRRVTVREAHLVRTFDDDVHIITHLESSEDHGVLHGKTHRAA
jgi:divalent metal cation (Fe/Co/Zn/Cd) transporter